jgi:hypothetical protein
MECNGNEYFVPRAGSYYHFITESAISLHDLLKRQGKLDNRDCHFWYQGPFGEIVQLFSSAPITCIPNRKPYLKKGHSIRLDIKTLKTIRLTQLKYGTLAGLAQYMGRHIPAEAAECGITLIKREKSREYAETDELANSLKSLNVPVRLVQLEKLAFAEQVRVLRSTRILIAPHGAGTINQIFMPPGAAIIELFPRGYSNWQQKGIAHALGHSFFEIESEKPSVYGRPPDEPVRVLMETHNWPDSARLRSLALSSVGLRKIIYCREFGRVLRDVASYSIGPEKILKLVKSILA